MKLIRIFIVLLVSLIFNMSMKGQETDQYNVLSSIEKGVIINKGTERAFTGKYNDNKEAGTYVCKQCGAALYSSESKFESNCGWPSFDDEIDGAVKRIPDRDGSRTEIVCANCNGHLGHVFLGEGYTAANTRHCVNSVSMDFVPAELDGGRYETAILAGGCFWGVEYFLQKEPGVESVVSGYIGGHVKNPSYKEICTGRTGHAEAVKVVFDPKKTSYEKIVRLFLEIHDPTQLNRQGPDIGNQYRSEIFFMNDSQKNIARDLLGQLSKKGLKIATQVTAASEFYEAENYHQDYYDNNGSKPYCHAYTKRF